MDHEGEEIESHFLRRAQAVSAQGGQSELFHWGVGRMMEMGVMAGLGN